MRLLRVSVLLFLLFGLSFAYFTQEDGNANVICRAGLVANVVQHGRIDIDEYQKWTVDKANFNGTYYCDKAPGQSFLAVPAAFAFTRMLPIAGSTIASNNRTWSAFVYACAVSTSGLISALGAVLCFRFLYVRTRRLGAGLVGSIAFALGTPVWGWATSFFSHATAASLLLMGLVALDRAASEIRRGECGLGSSLLAGLAFGAATSVEYTSVVPALLIGAAIAGTSPWRPRAKALVLAFVATGVAALVTLVPALAYHRAAFGSPFSLPYEHAAVFEATRTGFFGIRRPSASAMVWLVFSARRGLVWISPVMLAAAWAAVVAIRRRDTRAPALAAVLALASYLTINAGFSYPLGGWSTGPRYLTAGLGLMALPLGLAWPHLSTLVKRGSLALLTLSVVINLFCTAVDMAAPESLMSPITQHILPQVLDAHFRQAIPFKVLKSPGSWALAPLLIVWALLGWLLVRELRRAESNSPSPVQV